MSIGQLPGSDLVKEGIEDLREGRETTPALLVSIGAPRLRRLGIPIPDSSFGNPEHRLYRKLSNSNSNAAHSRYNALIRRLVSFERAAECSGDRGRLPSLCPLQRACPPCRLRTINQA